MALGFSQADDLLVSEHYQTSCPSTVDGRLVRSGLGGCDWVDQQVGNDEPCLSGCRENDRGPSAIIIIKCYWGTAGSLISCIRIPMDNKVLVFAVGYGRMSPTQHSRPAGRSLHTMSVDGSQGGTRRTKRR